jgi:hypothetical protein
MPKIKKATKNRRVGRVEGLIDEKTYEELEAIAKQDERSVRWMVGRMIRDAVEARRAA